MIKRPLSKLIKDIIAVQNRAGVEKSVLILQGKGAEKPIFQNQVHLSVIFRQLAVQNPAMSTEPKGLLVAARMDHGANPADPRK